VILQIPQTNAPDTFFEQFWLSCPIRFARGTTRDAYDIPDHPDKVLKVASAPGYYSNWAEIVIYRVSLDKSYFGEIISHSLSGKFLVMERLTPVTLADLSGLSFPAYLNDRKPSNFGRSSSGAIKALDYAMIDLSPNPQRPFP
jgi:hypothetical protein